MTLRPEYSLGHSEYNAFLFAAVGEEKVGLPLTVLTALTRLGFDPWQEAARLSDSAQGNRGSGIRRDDCDASRRRLEGVGLRGDRRSSGRTGCRCEAHRPSLQRRFVAPEAALK